MKRRNFRLFLFFPLVCVLSFICIVIIASNKSNAETIERLDVKSGNPCDDDLKTESSALDSVFNQILKQYKEDVVFIKRIKASQELWKKAATANIAAIFPNSESLTYGIWLKQADVERMYKLYTLRKGKGYYLPGTG